MLKDAIPLELLQRICNPFDHRRICQTPHQVVVDNRPYAVGTNAVILFAVSACRLSDPLVALPHHETLRALLTRYIHRRNEKKSKSVFAELKAWTGPDRYQRCKACCGTGSVKTSDDEDDTCGQCDGWGELHHDYRYGKIGNATINLDRLAVIIAHLQADYVQVAYRDASEFVRISTVDWHIMIMPTNPKIAVDAVQAGTRNVFKNMIA